MDNFIIFGLAFLYGIVFLMLICLFFSCCYVVIFKRDYIETLLSTQQRHVPDKNVTENLPRIPDHIYHELEDGQEHQDDEEMNIYEDIN